MAIALLVRSALEVTFDTFKVSIADGLVIQFQNLEKVDMIDILQSTALSPLLLYILILFYKFYPKLACLKCL